MQRGRKELFGMTEMSYILIMVWLSLSQVIERYTLDALLFYVHYNLINLTKIIKLLIILYPVVITIGALYILFQIGINTCIFMLHN